MACNTAINFSIFSRVRVPFLRTVEPRFTAGRFHLTQPRDLKTQTLRGEEKRKLLVGIGKRKLSLLKNLLIYLHISAKYHGIFFTIPCIFLSNIKDNICLQWIFINDNMFSESGNAGSSLHELARELKKKSCQHERHFDVIERGRRCHEVPV